MLLLFEGCQMLSHLLNSRRRRFCCSLIVSSLTHKSIPCDTRWFFSGLLVRFLSKTIRIATATRSLMNIAGQSCWAHTLGFLRSFGFWNWSQSLSSFQLSGETEKSLQAPDAEEWLSPLWGLWQHLRCEDKRPLCKGSVLRPRIQTELCPTVSSDQSGSWLITLMAPSV